MGLQSGAMASSTALVQLGARELGLTPYTGDGAAVGEPVERRLERLRQDRVAHSRKQIWTKEPHGGPYRKASGAACAPPPPRRRCRAEQLIGACQLRFATLLRLCR